MRHNDDTLEQLIDNAKAIPAMVALISEGRPADIQEQAAQLLGLLTSRFNDAKVMAVEVSAAGWAVQAVGCC